MDITIFYLNMDPRDQVLSSLNEKISILEKEIEEIKSGKIRKQNHKKINDKSIKCSQITKIL